MIGIFACCYPRQVKMDDFPELGNFERFSKRNLTIRKKRPAVTGMAKFRASQKLRRKKLAIKIELEKSILGVEKSRKFSKLQRRSLSQPTLTVKNYVPYDY